MSDARANRRSHALLAAFVATLALLAAPARAADPDGPTVLTGTQATYSLAVALTAGTPLRIVNVPPDGRQLALLKDYIERRKGALAPTFAAATAAITLTKSSPRRR